MLELLAPGGSYEGLKAAVNAGADAVYMGGTRFGARAYAQNPEEKDLLEAMDYCHLHGRKLYLTVNTLLKEQELEEELYTYLLPLYEHGLDAVLVQDFGVFRFIQRNFPQLPLHASTQMTITGIDGARMLKEMGAERIVPSRELSLEEIAGIHKEVEIEIECFVHGALCYCYSGQCLMSSLIGGRSGNRGRCAQPCRLPYDLYENGMCRNKEKERYLLSLKDICTLRLLPDLIEAGVCSFKIEGRMKRPEYAAGVTAVYRKYMDQYRRAGREGYQVDPEDERILMDLYNRGGFSDGYYQRYNGTDMMSMERPNHRGTLAAKVLETKRGTIRMKALENLWAKDALEAEPVSNEKISGRQKTSKSGKEPSGGSFEILMREDVSAGKEFVLASGAGRVRQGQILPRVRCEKLLQELQESYGKAALREKIKGKFILNPENPAILTVNWKHLSVTVHGETALPADNRPLEEETVRRQLMKTGNTPFVWEELEIVLGEHLFYPMQSLNELRRNALEQLQEKILGQFLRSHTGNEKSVNEKSVQQTGAAEPETQRKPKLLVSVETFEQLEAVLELPAVSGVYLDCCLFLPSGKGKSSTTLKEGAEAFSRAVGSLRRKGKKAYLMLPGIWRERTRNAFESVFSMQMMEQADGFLLRSSEQLEYLSRISRKFSSKKEVIADAGIYTYNKEARKFLKTFGVDRDTLPLECNRRELQQRGCEGSEAIVYGHLPLMISAQCVVKNTTGCRKIPGVRMLRDRKRAEFPVRNQCSICSNVIYNSVPLDLISVSREVLSLHPSSLRLSFTIENRAQVLEIAGAAEAGFLQEREWMSGSTAGTRGHFKRGVE